MKLGRELWLGVVVVGWGCWSKALPTAPAREPQLGLQVSSSQLESGLRVVHVPDARATEVTVTMRYAVGDSDDPPGREGMAHLVEHLLYEPILDGTSLFDRLQDAALEFNGQTTIEATTFTARGVPAQLGALLAIEAMRLEQRCGTISDAAFTRQREIVSNELRERAAYDRVEAAISRGVFPVGHPYHRAAPATVDTIATITRDEACAFADAHYAPGTAVLVVGGPITADDLTGALARSLAPVHRTAIARPAVAPVLARPRVTSPAPVDSPMVVIAWPLPAEPTRRARIRAVVGMLGSLVDARVNARVSHLEIGGERARFVGLVIAPARGVSPADALTGAHEAIGGMAQWLGSGLFEAARARAVYARFTTFEPGLERDLELADAAPRSRDLRAGIQAELDGLRGMGRDDARDLADDLELADATIVTLEPETSGRRTPGSPLVAPIHDVSRPIAEDPAEAHRPAKALGGPDPLAAGRSRMLANGMRVVLLPLSNIRTVDVRVVFPTGTAGEPSTQRGVALLAGHALHTAAGDGPEMLEFWMAGGNVDVDVDLDQTAFIARGLDTYLDRLLIGLGHTLRGGIYDSLSETVDQLRSRATDDDLVATAVWRAALYGERHPYVAAGSGRASTLELDDVRAFQQAHYVPDGATLIIAGGFDPVLADRWVDYVFGDWRATSTRAPSPRAALRPLPFAQHQDTSQLALHVALPTFGANRATALVVTEMLALAIAAVRQELAASYGLAARLAESRASTTIVIGGLVDARRAADAMRLVRDRLAGLREPSADTAARFVTARRRVMNRLTSLDTGAAALADLVQRHEALDRRFDADRGTAEAVRTLELRHASAMLGTLDLANAAMLLRGPGDSVTAAYDAIGRQPVRLETGQ